MAGFTGCSSSTNDQGSATTGVVSTTAPVTTAPPTTTPPTTVAPTTVAPTTTAVATTIVGEAAARAAVTKMWETFLDKAASVETRKALVDNGSAHAASLALLTQNPLIGQANGVVKKVTFTSPQRADVVYDITVGGAVALPNAQGVAVLVAGQWKVGEETYCGLVILAIAPPPPDCA